jgi:hypothetical protein
MYYIHLNIGLGPHFTSASDLPRGAKHTPGEIRQMVKDDKNMQNLTEEEKKELIDKLSEH